MVDTANAKIKQTRRARIGEFIRKYKTPVACVVTAVVTAKVTRDRTMKTVSEFLYEKGYEAGTLGMLLDEAYAFIKEHDLESEFVEYAHVPEVS